MKISTILGELVDKVLKLTGALLSPARITLVLDWAKIVGHFAVITNIMLALVWGLRNMHGNAAALIPALVIIVLTPFAQFCAMKFLGAGDKLIANTPGRISSMAVLDCLGLVLLILAIVLFFAGIVGVVATSSPLPFFIGLLASILCIIGAGIYLNPSLVNTEVGSGSAGEEAIGLLLFVMKQGLKIVPAAFCMAAIAGCLIPLFMPSAARSGYGEAGAQIASTPVLPLIACFIPLIAYLEFLFFSLILDICRAILVLPSKIDSLKK